MGGVAAGRPETRMRSVLVRKSKDQEHAIMRTGLCSLLVATQWIGTWVSVAQTNSHPTPRHQSAAIQVSTCPVAAVSAGHANPAMAIAPRALDFGSVAVGDTRTLAFTVQNAGVSMLNGAAKVSAPFRIVSGSPYALGSAQSQVITVQYVPKAVGMNMAVVLLSGGDGTRITVVGSGARAPAPVRRTAPAAPGNLRVFAGR